MSDTIVVLYDIENSSFEMLEFALEKARAIGSAPIYVYSDWTICGKKKKWQDLFHRRQAIFIQIGRALDGKNALDKALFETALTLRAESIKNFVIVTSDTDFIKLAQKLRLDKDARVVGVGANIKDEKLKEAYDQFYCYAPSAAPPAYDETGAFLSRLFAEAANGRVWVPLSEIGTLLKRKHAAVKFPQGYPPQLKKIFALHRDQFELKQEGMLVFARANQQMNHPAGEPAGGALCPSADVAAPVGIEQPDAEARYQWKIALLMLKEGIDRRLIQKIMDLSEKDIDDLRCLLARLRD